MEIDLRVSHKTLCLEPLWNPQLSNKQQYLWINNLSTESQKLILRGRTSAQHKFCRTPGHWHNRTTLNLTNRQLRAKRCIWTTNTCGFHFRCSLLFTLQSSLWGWKLCMGGLHRWCDWPTSKDLTNKVADKYSAVLTAHTRYLDQIAQNDLQEKASMLTKQHPKLFYDIL